MTAFEARFVDDMTLLGRRPIGSDSLGVRAGGAADEQLYLPVRHYLS
jgi:hypothetical protein